MEGRVLLGQKKRYSGIDKTAQNSHLHMWKYDTQQGEQMDHSVRGAVTSIIHMGKNWISISYIKMNSREIKKLNVKEQKLRHLYVNTTSQGRVR